MKTPVTQFEIDAVGSGKMDARFIGRKGPYSAEQGNIIFWEFEVLEDDELKVVTGITSVSFSHDLRCKAYRWAKVIDPSLTDKSVEWDDEAAIGNEVIIEVVQFRSGDTERPTVKDIYPCPPKARDIQ